MTMLYHGIPGWFDFQHVYDNAIASATPGGTLVEVGCWYGKSLTYLLQKAKTSKLNLRIVGVDHFMGSIGEPEMQEEAIAKEVEQICRENCAKAGYSNYEILSMSSVAAATAFDNNSLDMVYIDAGHEETDVAQDIHAWLPKVRHGGILAGHDLNMMGVASAVRKMLSGFIASHTSWVYHKR